MRRLFRKFLRYAGCVESREAYTGPQRAEIYLTNKCNLDCIACWTFSPLLAGTKPTTTDRDRMGEGGRVDPRFGRRRLRRGAVRWGRGTHDLPEDHGGSGACEVPGDGLLCDNQPDPGHFEKGQENGRVGEWIGCTSACGRARRRLTMQRIPMPVGKSSRRSRVSCESSAI